MNTKEIIDALNESTSDMYGFSFKDAKLSVEDESCLIEIYYKDGVILLPAERAKAETFITQRMPTGFKYKIKFIKNFITEDTIKPKINQFFEDNMPSVVYSILGINNDNSGFKISIEIEDKTFDYFNKKDGSKKLSAFLEKEFCLKFNIDIVEKKTTEVEVEELEDLPFFEIQEKTENTLDITHVEEFIGDIIFDNPICIKDAIGKERKELCVCGKVKFFKEYTYERKPRENKKANAKENEIVESPSVGTYYKWVLEDFTDKVKCIFFTNKNNIEAIQKLSNDCQIVVIGDLEKDKFGESYTLKVKRISWCELPEKYEEKIEYKTESKDYMYVYPEPVEITAQVDLFSAFLVQEEKVPKYLQNRSIVVFDFETTGINLSEGHKIIEIGAVKIINGKIKEKFMCFVDPEMHIPEASTKIHGIVDKDVLGAPKIDEALQDFYKFTRGSVLSGYNIIGFDMNYLIKFGKDSRYNFDNEVIDVYPLAMKNVKGVKNYRLRTVAEKLGVTLDNAHRAVYDAMATAEVLIKLADFI